MNNSFLLAVLGSFWTKIWKDPDYVRALVAGVLPGIDDIETRASDLKRMLSLSKFPILRSSSALGVVIPRSQLLPDPLRIGSFNIGQAFIGDKAWLPGWHFDSSPCAKAVCLADSPVDPSIVWLSGQEFEVEAGIIHFRKDPFQTFQVGSFDGSDDCLNLWLLNCKVDADYLNEAFGKPLGLHVDSSELGRRRLQVLWALKSQGATAANIGEVLSVFSDSIPPLSDGTVEAVWTEQNYSYALVAGQLCRGPSGASCTAEVGDSVAAGEDLFGVFSATTSTPSSDYMPILTLGPGMLSSEYEGSLGFFNFSQALIPGTDAWSFPLAGSAKDVALFRTKLASIIGGRERAILCPGQAGPAYTVNPADFIWSNLLSPCLLFLSATAATTTDQALLEALRQAMPAGTALAGALLGSTTVDTVSADDLGASAFSLAYASEASPASAGEYIKAGLKIY